MNTFGIILDLLGWLLSATAMLMAVHSDNTNTKISYSVISLWLMSALAR